MKHDRIRFPIGAVALLCALLIVLAVPGCGGAGGTAKSTTGQGKVAQQTSPAASAENAEEPADTSASDYTPAEIGTEPGANAEGDYEVVSAAAPSAAAQARKWNSQQLLKIDAEIKNRGSKGFTFAVLGDNHRNYPVFRGLLNEIKKDGSLFVIDCGDLGQTGSNESFSSFIGNAKSYPMPMMVGIGNHDLTRVDHHMVSSTFKQYFGRTYYAFTLQRSKFIMLDDSNRTGLGDTETKWLESQLKKADDSRKYDHCFVFMHVPITDPSHHGAGPGHGILSSKNAKAMQALFDKHHVSVIFTGHVHGSFEGKWGKTSYVITGGAGGNLGGSDPKHFFYHYLEVTLKPGQHPSWKVVKLSKASTSSVLVPFVLGVPGGAPVRVGC